jgi:hypothetical protein
MAATESKFDAAAFAAQLLDEARTAIKPLLEVMDQDARTLVAQFDTLETDMARTLLAIQATTDKGLQAMLQADLTVFLPARKAALLAAVATKASGDVQALVELALTVVEKAAIIAAKSFVPIP